MRCSADIRKRVVRFVRAGGSQAEAARRFGVGTMSVYRWLKQPDATTYQKPGPRQPHKLDWAALAAYVKAHPDAMQTEMAAHFGVSAYAVWYALRQMKTTRKKNVAV